MKTNKRKSKSASDFSKKLLIAENISNNKSCDNTIISTAMNKEIENMIPLNKKFIIAQWKKIEKMRNNIEAPVDTMGVTNCSEIGLQESDFCYQTLVSLLLSSQTKDETTYKVISKLINHGLNIENINKTSLDGVEELIKGVNYYKTKAKNIKSLTEIISTKYNCIPPKNIKDVLTLPGIGQKMGNLYMQTCFEENSGIVVDTHVHRISNRLKWANSTNQPEKTRKELQEWLPVKLWGAINTLLVGFGQTICKSIKPLCEDCLLKNECEYGIDYLENKKLFSKRSLNNKKSIEKKRKPKIKFEI